MWILHYNSSSTAPLFIEVLTRLAILSSSGSFRYFISGFSFDISSVGIIDGSIVLGTSKDSYFLIIFETKSYLTVSIIMFVEVNFFVTLGS